MYKTPFILRWFGDSSNHFIENIHSNMLEYMHTLALSQSWIELKTKVRTCRYLTLNVWTMTNCKVCWCPDLLCIMQPFASTNTCSQFFTHSTFLSLGRLQTCCWLLLSFFSLLCILPFTTTVSRSAAALWKLIKTQQTIASSCPHNHMHNTWQKLDISNIRMSLELDIWFKLS